MQNTIVIFMSDNGMTPGGSGKAGESLGTDTDQKPMGFFNAGMKGLKNSADEGGLRVPFFLRWDGHWPAGRDVDRIAGDIDIFPTIAALAAATQPQGQVEGRNLVPLLDDPQRSWTDRYLFTHIGRWPTGSEPNDYQWKTFSIRSQKYRLVNNNQLFDMEADPGQTTNVLEQHPEVVEQMRTAWQEWWTVTRPMMVNETAAMSPTRPFHVLYNAQFRAGGIPEWAPKWSGEHR
jgi:arylsulfatase